MNLDLTSSLVTYHNDPAVLQKAIDSFLTTQLNARLMVIDNSRNSEIGTQITDPRCEYIFNQANIGFGAAHNIGIKKILDRSKYHLILNPDVSFPAGTLEKLYDFMEKN